MIDRRFLLVILLFILVDIPISLAATIGSEQYRWKQRTMQEKQAYLDGLCSALSAGANLKMGVGRCKSEKANDITYILSPQRFCFANAVDRARGVEHFDLFYANPEHSEVPNWAVVAAYNDKVCGEDVVMSRLKKLQEHGRCMHELVNMGVDDPSAFDTKRAKCDRIDTGRIDSQPRSLAK